MKNKFLLAISLVSVLFSSCSLDQTRYNVDPKNPTDVNPDYIFASAEVNLAFLLANTSVNSNNFRLFTQQITETQYTDEAKYNLVVRSFPDNFWNSLYTQLNKIKTVKGQLATDSSASKENKLATLEALEIYIYSILIDTYGDVPYSQALNVENFPNPKYDDGLTVYKDLISRINTALTKINVSEGTFPTDAIFDNDMNNVVRFLNSLKLRMGLNLADVDNAYAKSTVESAVAAGVISSNTESINLLFDTTGLFSSPIYQDMVASGRNDYVAANTLVDYMNTQNDPRRDKFFTTVGGIYKGGIYGSVNNYSLFSHVNDSFLIPNYSSDLFSYSEVEFMLAEAIERGYAVGGTAAAHFENGVRASMAKAGVSSVDTDAYVLANNYITLPGTWKQKIGNEAWIATYFRGIESWGFSRRLDFRTFVAPASFALPVRLPYPVKEVSVNNDHRKEAVLRQWGSLSSDVQGTKIFWDKN